MLWAADGIHLDLTRGETVFNEHKNTVVKLQDLIRSKSTINRAVLQGFRGSILAADLRLAKVAIAEAAGGAANKIR